MSGGGAWGRGTGTEPADGPDGAGARAPARGSGAACRGPRVGAERRRAADGAGGAVLGRGRSLRALEGVVCDFGKVSGALPTLTHFAGRALGVSADHPPGRRSPSAETGRLDHGVSPSRRAPGFQFGVRKPAPLRRRWGACPGILEAAPAPRDWAARPLHLAVGRWGSSSRPGGGRGCSSSRGADPSENGDAPGPEWACARLGEDRTS